MSPSDRKFKPAKKLVSKYKIKINYKKDARLEEQALNGSHVDVFEVGSSFTEAIWHQHVAHPCWLSHAFEDTNRLTRLRS